MGWDTKYRPLKYADVLGQDSNVQALKARLRLKTAFDTSYIFAGGYGRGKTTLARIHARAMLCQNLSDDLEPCNQCPNCLSVLDGTPGPYREQDAASNNSVDAMRTLIDELHYVMEGAYRRISLFDEAHQLTVQAQDVALKPLEEGLMIGMFCTTEAHKLRGAIRSRCESYTIRKASRESVQQRMRYVLEQEGVRYEDDAILIVYDYVDGHTRDVLKRLETISQFGDVTVANVRDYFKISIHGLYYEILLNLDQPGVALELLDRVCEQVSPEDAAVGLAEAAMNSYRMAHRGYIEFLTVDRSLGEALYTKYQDELLSFVSWFQRGKYHSKLALERDLAVFSLNAGKPIAQERPPVVLVTNTITEVRSAKEPVIEAPRQTVQVPPVTPVPVQPPPPPVEVSVAEPVARGAVSTVKQGTISQVQPKLSDIERVARGKVKGRMRGSVTIERTLKKANKSSDMHPNEWAISLSKFMERRIPKI